MCAAINLSVFRVSMQKAIDFQETGSNRICMIRIRTIAVEALMHMGVALTVTIECVQSSLWTFYFVLCAAYVR